MENETYWKYWGRKPENEKSEKNILNPDQINDLVSYLISDVLLKGKKYPCHGTEKQISLLDFDQGIHLSKLIQKSYNAGYNDFKINTKGTSVLINAFGSYLNGSKENPLRLNMVGDVGECCAAYSNYLILNLEGKIILPFCTGDNPGKYNPQYMTFKELPPNCGFSLAFPEFAEDSKNSTFQTTNEQTYEHMLFFSSIFSSKKNKFKLLDKYGRLIKSNPPNTLRHKLKRYFSR